MSEWTLYTYADWWNVLAWKWWPRFSHSEREAVCAFLFFSVRRQWL